MMTPAGGLPRRGPGAYNPPEAPPEGVREQPVGALSAVAPEDPVVTGDHLSLFQAAGRELAAAGLVYPGAGNLSVWTPEAVLITSEGARLDALDADDVSPMARTTTPPV